MFGRRALGVAAVLAGPSLAWLGGLGACSADSATNGFSEDAGGAETSLPFDDAAPLGEDAEDAIAVVFGDDANADNPDAGPTVLCPGAAVPVDATSAACAADMSESCPACAAWGFVCAGWASPQMQDASASAFCRATELEGGEGGTLVCCTQPACVVSTVTGQCDASSQTRYECSGGAVPRGSCDWLGAGAPNDYCCQ